MAKKAATPSKPYCPGHADFEQPAHSEKDEGPETRTHCHFCGGPLLGL